MKDKKTEQFISVMFNILKAIEAESEYCCKICGGISEKELFVLVFVGQNVSIKMSDLAESLKVPLSTLTSIVDKLVANNFLMRFSSEEDRRVVKIALAEKGKKSYTDFMKEKKKNASKVLSQFKEGEKEVLIEYLTKLSSALNLKG